MRRILVVKLDHLGDCLTALPALRRLKRHFPDARISVLAGRASRPIWAAEAVVDEVIDFEFFNARSGLGKVDVTAAAKAALEKSLRKQRFDLAVDLRKQPDTREVLRMSGARHLAGFDHQGRFPWLNVALEWDEDVPLRTKRGHVSDDLIVLVDALSAKFEPPRDVVLRQPKTALRMPKRAAARLFSKPLVCIHAASGAAMRQWPLAKFFELVELLLELERFHIALIGGPDEIEFLRPLTALTSARAQVFNLVGQLTLDELPSVLARAALFVGNNSGPQHLAAALGVPTIGIHSGVVDATEWGPVGRHALALRRAMACSPCFLERPEDCHRGVACLTELPVGEVYRASLRSLGIAAMTAPETHA